MDVINLPLLVSRKWSFFAGNNFKYMLFDPWRTEQNGQYFADNILQMHFLEWKLDFFFHYISVE